MKKGHQTYNGQNRLLISPPLQVYLNSVNSTSIYPSLKSETGITPDSLSPYTSPRTDTPQINPVNSTSQPSLQPPNHLHLLCLDGCTSSSLTCPLPCLFFSSVHPPKKRLGHITLLLKQQLMHQNRFSFHRTAYKALNFLAPSFLPKSYL